MYELRRHLANAHRIVMWGAGFDTLAVRHDDDHRSGGVDHDHDHNGEGDG